MRFVTLTFLLCLAASCTTNPALPPDVAKRIFIAESAIQSIRITQVSRTIRHDGVPQLVINGKPSGLNPVKVRYRVLWFDRDGAPIQTVLSAWKSVSLVKGRPVAWTALAPHPNAFSYQLEIEKSPN